MVSVIGFSNGLYYEIIKHFDQISKFSTIDLLWAGCLLLLLNAFLFLAFACHYCFRVEDENVHCKKQDLHAKELLKEQEKLQSEQQKMEAEQSWKKVLQWKIASKKISH